MLSGGRQGGYSRRLVLQRRSSADRAEFCVHEIHHVQKKEAACSFTITLKGCYASVLVSEVCSVLVVTKKFIKQFEETH